MTAPGRIDWRVADLIVGALVGNPVRAVLIGGLVLVAFGHWLGWWSVVAIAVAALVDLVWCALQLPARWRPW